MKVFDIIICSIARAVNLTRATIYNHIHNKNVETVPEAVEGAEEDLT